MFISTVRSLQSGFKRNLKDKEKCEEGNRQCTLENILKIGIIPSHTNEHIPQIIKLCIKRFTLGKIHITVVCVAKNPSPVAA
jgi:hypothetical protein